MLLTLSITNPILYATRPQTGEVFALKQLERDKIRRLSRRHKNIYNEILMEKAVLARLDHPGITRLYHTFQDPRHLFFLLQYASGGELWCKLMAGEHQVGMPLSHAKFYTHQILDAIEYLHQQGIAHRCGRAHPHPNDALVQPLNHCVCVYVHAAYPAGT